MHKLILWLFKKISFVEQVVSIIGSLFIIILSLCLLRDILHTQWEWLDSVQIITNPMVNLAQKIFPSYISVFGLTIGIKYISVIIFVIILMLTAEFFLEKTENLQDLYKEMHFKKMLDKEKALTKTSMPKISLKQIQDLKYIIMIYTRSVKKSVTPRDAEYLKELNKMINNLIFEKTNVKYAFFDNGYLYSFSNFANIDKILNTLLKIFESHNELEYAICINADLELEKVKKLGNFKEYGKIIITDETLNMYNAVPNKLLYATSIGVYQKDQGTYEIYELK